MTGFKEQDAQTSNKQQMSQKAMFFSAFGMGAGTLISRVLGLLRDVALAAFFSKTILDAFAIGFRLPNFFRRVLGEGALSVSFIPQYLELKASDPEQSQKLRNIMFSFLFLVSSLLCFFGVLYIEEILNLIVDKEKFSPDGVSFDLAVRMARWMFCYLFLVTQFAYCMSTLNAHKKFWVAGLAPAFFNVGFLLCIFIPNHLLGFEGQELAFGVLLGGVLQAGTVGLSFVKAFGLPDFDFSFLFKPFKTVVVSTLPSLFAIGVLQMISLINIHFCSEIGPGANSFLYFADRILELPQSLIAVSLGTAMLPSLSEMWITSRKNFDKTLIKSLRVYLFFALPSAAGLFFLALPITQLLFQRGAFQIESAVEVASIVKIYGLLLIVSGLGRILLPVYYSFKNTWYPALIAVAVLMNHYFIGSMLVESFGFEGVAFATLSSSLVNLGFLFLGLKVFIGKTYLKSIFVSLVHFTIPSLLLIGFLVVVERSLPLEKDFLDLICIVLAICFSVVLYFASSFVFKVEEAGLIKSLIFKIRR